MVEELGADVLAVGRRDAFVEFAAGEPGAGESHRGGLGPHGCVAAASDLHAHRGEVERDNDGARYGVVWIKRRGTTDPGKSYVLMTGADFTRMLGDAMGTTP